MADGTTRGFQLSPVDLTDLYPRLGDLLARVEVKTERVWAQEPGFLADAARDLLSGRGKRLRPTLLLLAAECAGGATDSSIAIASMIEVVHAASLVHDDVIDDAPSRRGRRSAKVVWGNKVSVLLGDYLIARAFSLVEREDSHCLIGPLCDVAARMCGGQVGELRARGPACDRAPVPGDCTRQDRQPLRLLRAGRGADRGGAAGAGSGPGSVR